MSMLVAVAGATGKQGGAVVNALLAEGFKVRGLTRNPSSNSGKSLAAKGVEVVTADFDKPETLKAAFDGCAAAFLVTNFWEHLDPAKEVAQASQLADAAVAAGVKHLVWSTLEDTRPSLGDSLPALVGDYKVPHFDAKAEASKYMDSKGHPVTHLNTAMFMENFTAYFKPHPFGEGVFAITAPPTKGLPMPLTSVDDIGRITAAIIKEGKDKFAGKWVPCCTDAVSFQDAAAVISEVTGKKVVLNEISDDKYVEMLKGFGMPEIGAKEMDFMFQYYAHSSGNATKCKPVSETRAVLPGAVSFRQWAEAHKDAFF